MKDKKVIFADLALILVAFVWGSGFVATKSALDHMTPFYILGSRFLIASTVLALFSMKRLKKATFKDVKAGLVVGIFMFFCYVFQTVGLQYTTVGTQAFIISANIVMVPFFYWALTRKMPGGFEIAAAFVCFLGVGILSLDNDLRVGYGEFLSFLCAVSVALQIVAVGYYAKNVDVYVLSVVQFSLAAVLSIIMAFILEPPVVQVQSGLLSTLLYLGLFSTMIPFLIQNIAQRYTTSTHTAIILSTEAVFGSLLGVVILGEEISIKFLIGCTTIFMAVIASETRFAFLKPRKKETTA
ncbi:MAG: DMT family transporter [Gudongella sp.]|nr:DMT family transporter [Gudongella sp.]